MYAKPLVSVSTFLPLILCIIDVCAYTLFEQPCMYALLALLCLELVKGISKERFAVFALLLSLESFLYYGIFGIQLIFIPLLAFVGLLVREYLYPRPSHPYIVLAITLFAQMISVEYLILGLKPAFLYTIVQFSGNFMILALLSLTYNEN